MINVEASDVNSVAKTEELMCDLQRTAESNMLDGTGYSEPSSRRMLQRGSGSGKPPPKDGGSGGSGMGGPGGSGGGKPSSLATSSGIALSGAKIFNAISG